MNNSVILYKIHIIERCMKRIRDVYNDDSINLKAITRQDSIIMNIQRACLASINLAMHVISEHHCGLPETSKDAFDMLKSHSIIDEDTAQRLKALIDFSNIAVKVPQSIKIDTLKQIVDKQLVDFIDFTKLILKLN
jgi:uncharacterized protein YutE (UPF0331/DUF86 family)